MSPIYGISWDNEKEFLQGVIRTLDELLESPRKPLAALPVELFANLHQLCDDVEERLTDLHRWTA